MIRKLRTKFICVIMVIVTVMLSCILGIVIHFTARSMQIQSINMMREIAVRPFRWGSLEKPKEDVRLPFFLVQIDNQGKLTNASGGYFDLTDQNDIQNIVDAALQSERETGVLDEFDLRYLKTVTPKGYTVVFSDTTAEDATIRQLLYSCVLILFAATAVFFGISIFLSAIVIKPVEIAWNQQRQFVADASHELKTPLSVIMASAELMQGEDSSEEERRKYARNILNMTYQMRTLVENMLKMARVDNGSVKMNFEDLDFSQLVTDALLSFSLLYEERMRKIDSYVQEDMHVYGSEQHLYQVMDVLLDNALKYSDPGGTVRVDLVQNGRFCILSVESPGEPISKDDLKNIFKRFYRADKARAMDGSYGLGLSIAEAVVLMHKGKIWAQSGQNQNVFFVQIPLNPSK